MTTSRHVCKLQPARAPQSLLPRCPRNLRQQRCRSQCHAAEADQLTAAQEHEQQVPLHIARRLEALQQEVQQAYQSGYQAGYTAGIKVQVNVGVELPSSQPTQQQQQQQRNSSTEQGSRSSSQQSQQEAAAAAVKADSLVRSAVKGLVWRLFSTTATMGIALLIFHDFLKVEDALKLGALEFTVKFMLYFVHERIWAAITLL